MNCIVLINSIILNADPEQGNIANADAIPDGAKQGSVCLEFVANTDVTPDRAEESSADTASHGAKHGSVCLEFVADADVTPDRVEQSSVSVCHELEHVADADTAPHGAEQGSFCLEFVADADVAPDGAERHELEFVADADSATDGAEQVSIGIKFVADADVTSVGFEFVADPNEPSSDESVGCSSRGDDVSDDDSDFEELNENAPPISQQESVANAMKIVSLHPMRDIIRKSRTRACLPVELNGFKACIKEYLLQLFFLTYCFAKYPGTFTKCNCLVKFIKCMLL
jgi:hypothetical protein